MYHRFPKKSRSALRRSSAFTRLTRQFRCLDAGEMVMIIDARHSAASVQGEGFKPGPMGSRGLGQLAYDKRMRIAASQADDVAREVTHLGHGLLTSALINDGLLKRLADHKPQDQAITVAEWLEYGVRRVPELHKQARSGQIQITEAARGVLVSLSREAVFQTPALFDFRKTGDTTLSPPRHPDAIQVKGRLD